MMGSKREPEKTPQPTRKSGLSSPIKLRIKYACSGKQREGEKRKVGKGRERKGKEGKGKERKKRKGKGGGKYTNT